MQPVAEICRAVRAVNPETLIHTDGVQAFGKLDGSLAGLRSRPGVGQRP